MLSHELQSAQAQAAQPYLMLEFREQGFHLLSLPRTTILREKRNNLHFKESEIEDNPIVFT